MGVQAISCMGVQAIPCMGVQAIPCMGVQAIPCMGVQAISCMGVQAIPCMGVQAIPCMGVQAISCMGVQAIPCMGVQAITCMGVQAIPCMGVQAIPCMGVQAIPCMGVQAIPSMGVQAIPCMGVQAIPCMRVQAIPCMGVQAIPCMGVQAIPCMGVQAIPCLQEHMPGPARPTWAINKTSACSFAGLNSSKRGMPVAACCAVWLRHESVGSCTAPVSHVAAVSLDLLIATVIAAPLPVTSSLATPVATTFLPPLFALLKTLKGSSCNLVCATATKDHPNLVKLLGFAIGITDKTRVEQILIYELMPNGDLSNWIGEGVHWIGKAVQFNSAWTCSASMPPHPVGRPEAVSPLSFERRVQQQLAQSGSRAVVAWLKQTRMEARDDLVLTVLQLALRCTSKQSATRPAMGVIAAELEAVLVALGGAHRNAGARQVDLEVESQKMSATCLDTEIARLNDML
ncbi:unnamed protein product [Closterium sp. NIES-65]|nr:unnamed protein product [Closterium sp. NIES-65]